MSHQKHLFLKRTFTQDIILNVSYETETKTYPRHRVRDTLKKPTIVVISLRYQILPKPLLSYWNDSRPVKNSVVTRTLTVSSRWQCLWHNYRPYIRFVQTEVKDSLCQHTPSYRSLLPVKHPTRSSGTPLELGYHRDGVSSIPATG